MNNNRKELEARAQADKAYVENAKKRKRIIIENEDGTTEEYNEGIFVTFKVHDDKAEFVSMHCNTKPNLELYARGICNLGINLLENCEKIEEAYNRKK